MTKVNGTPQKMRLFLHLGFSGTRHGMSDFQKAFLENLVADKAGIFHHGDCIGADAEAHDIVRKFPDFWKIRIHPPAKSENRAYKIGDEYRQPLPYSIRNAAIVESTSVLIACPLNKRETGGTWNTIKRADRRISEGAPKQCYIVMPNGDVGAIILDKTKSKLPITINLGNVRDG